MQKQVTLTASYISYVLVMGMVATNYTEIAYMLDHLT